MPDISTPSDLAGPSGFDACLKEQLVLCQRLEDLADSLPSQIDTLAATRLAKRLLMALRKSHALEERVVFPALRATGVDVHPILDRLRKEHQEDEDHACDIQDSLRAFITGRDGESAEKLGYMLRCLFVSLRRHLAFDRDYVLPLFERVQTP